MILANSHERLYPTKPLVKGDGDEDEFGEVRVEQMGSFVLKGDSIAVIGELDREAEAAIPWDRMRRCHPIPPIHH